MSQIPMDPLRYRQATPSQPHAWPPAQHDLRWHPVPPAPPQPATRNPFVKRVIVVCLAATILAFLLRFVAAHALALFKFLNAMFTIDTHRLTSDSTVEGLMAFALLAVTAITALRICLRK